MDNPYLVMREALELNQVTLAKLANVTDQYIRRMEVGTVSSPSGSLNRALYDYALSQPNGLEKLLIASHQALVTLTRATIRPYRGPLTFTDYAELNTFVDAWWDFWKLVVRSRLTSESLRATKNIYALCRALLIHPYILQRYVKTSYEREVELPAEIRTALAQAGISQLAFFDVLATIEAGKND